MHSSAHLFRYTVRKISAHIRPEITEKKGARSEMPTMIQAGAVTKAERYRMQRQGSSKERHITGFLGAPKTNVSRPQASVKQMILDNSHVGETALNILHCRAAL